MKVKLVICNSLDPKPTYHFVYLHFGVWYRIGANFDTLTKAKKYAEKQDWSFNMDEAIKR